MSNKLTIYALALSLGLPAFSYAQDAEPARDKKEKELSFKSVHGHEVLPQKGDWALGISATGFLNYLGNIANNSTFNNAPNFNSANAPTGFAIGQLSGVALSGKYMKSDDLAYRVRFQANAGNVDYRNLVLKNTLTPDPLNPQTIEDKQSTFSYTVLLGAGFEKRRGNNRLQGFYGAEALVGMAGKNVSYTYGNNFSVDFNAPVSTTDFATGLSGAASSRIKSQNTGAMMLFGVRGFAGIEYFFAPKISLGGEIGYTLGMSTNGKETTKTIAWNPATQTTNTITTNDYTNSGLRSFGIGIDNVNAGINLHFYF